jgi:hypothetical protein
MTTLFAVPALLNLVLTVLVLEGLAVLALGSRRRQMRAALPLLATLASGFALVLGWRLASLDYPWWSVLLCLLAALAAHLTDITVRHR